MSIVHFNEEELTKILKKNPKLKPVSEGVKDLLINTVDSNEKKFEAKASENKEKKPRLFELQPAVKKTKKRGQTSLTRSGIISKDIRNAETQVAYNDNYFGVLFPESKLLTVNDIFTLIQSPKKQGVVWSYKKSWHNKIRDILKAEHEKANNEGKNLPFFNEYVELTLFRQSPTLVDKDALTTMFKYIIDAFKYHERDNPYGILAEDNPNIVCSIRCETLKEGKRNENNFVGFRIKKTTPSSVVFKPEDILKEFS